MAQAIDLLSGPRPHPSFGAPGSAAYIENDHHCWLHVFPEGRVIQQPANNEKTGYFKWGVSRLILESDPAPDLVPIFMQGLQHIMPEDRGWPRWAPRIGVPVRIAFGMPVNIDERFSHHRSRWRRLVQGLDLSQRGKALHELPDVLKYGEEACDIRMRVASDVKMHVTELAHHIEGAAGRGER
jgi:monolysocardiolipin acyltransferase